MKFLRLVVCLTASTLALGACTSDRGSGASSAAPPRGSAAARAGTSTDVRGPRALRQGKTFAVGGSVSGLSGTGLVLSNNEGDDIPIGSSGVFYFPKQLPGGSPFSVAIKKQPSAPSQVCTVSGGTGTVAGGNVTTVAVTCATGAFTVGGSVTGLEGANLVLQNMAGDDLSVAANGSFAFATPLESATPFAVTIESQPTSPSQTCLLGGDSGTIGDSDVTGVTLTCTTNAYEIGGTVTGLAGTGLVIQNDAGDDLPISADGTFAFPTAVKSGSTYTVTVKSKPTSPSQSCAVTRGVGTVGGGDVTDIAITCETDAFTVGGTASGLAGSGLVLQNGSGDDLAITSSGSFTFDTKVLSGGAYAVTVKSQPSSPSQTCSVSAASGSVTNGNVTTVAVNCTTNDYVVGGSVAGLTGTGLVLQNGGGDDLTINGNGAFAFGTPVASGASYAVTVKTQPTLPSQTCTIEGASGTVGGGDIGSVSVTCITSTYAIGGSITGLDGGSVVLKNNGGDELTRSADGAFAFATKIASGSSYAVTVATHPAGKYCLVKNGSGSVGATDVSNVEVSCLVTNGSVLDVSGASHRILYRACGDGSVTGCTKAVAESSCTAVGAKLVSHASDGTSSVASLGATTSCQWSISYYTNDAAELAGQCLIGMSNVDWSGCCGHSTWHGNVVTIPATLGEQFGYVDPSNSGYYAALTNAAGSRWGCNDLGTPPPAREGCSTYYVACQW